MEAMRDEMREAGVFQEGDVTTVAVAVAAAATAVASTTSESLYVLFAGRTGFAVRV